MPAVKKILCPVDFSETSRRALGWAVTLAQTCGAALEVVHAIEDAPEMTAYSGGVPRMSAAQDARDSAQRALEEWMAALPETARARVSADVIEGRSYKAIVRHAAETGADLIVMGTHGRSGFKQAILGSVAERVVRRAPCPVLVVPPGAAE